MRSKDNKIDVVITWVDGNDPKWREEKQHYEQIIKGIDKTSDNNARYREWDNIQYIFRGIEKYMPWVNKVHFVTWGHLPEWLNTDYEKLHVVNHKDFMSEEYLPTFNSNAIVLNLHRIPGLAEQFVFFNDDTFVIAPTKPEDFFVNGKPKDTAVLSPPPCFRDVMCNIEINNFEIINDHFSMEDVKKNRKKWYYPGYGKQILRTILFSRFKTILGIYEMHIPNSYLKSTMNEVWDKEYEVLDSTSKNKFRTREDVNDWLFRHWQMMSGDFEPRRWEFGILMDVAFEEDNVIKLLKNPQKTKMVCINDTPNVVDFERTKRHINKALHRLLPEKSKFEK